MSAARAFLDMSHSPLLGLNPLPAGVQAELDSAIDEAGAKVRRWQPDRIVLIAPDHCNGFFNELMPPFCIGTAATSVGGYLTPADALNVDTDAALGLAEHLMEGFDVAMSRRMLVDHGFAQALRLLWGSLDTPPVVPIFTNAVAMPGIPRLGRCHALGVSIGAFLDGLPGRTLLLGSGGLSHEPPVPTLAHVDAAVRERITGRQTPTAAERDAKTERVKAAGVALVAGDPRNEPINPLGPALDSCDRARRLRRLLSLPEASIECDAGLSVRESKTWLIGRSAMPADRSPAACTLRYYRAIPELIAGYGLLFL